MTPRVHVRADDGSSFYFHPDVHNFGRKLILLQLTRQLRDSYALAPSLTRESAALFERSKAEINFCEKVVKNIVKDALEYDCNKNLATCVCNAGEGDGKIRCWTKLDEEQSLMYLRAAENDQLLPGPPQEEVSQEDRFQFDSYKAVMKKEMEEGFPDLIGEYNDKLGYGFYIEMPEEKFF